MRTQKDEKDVKDEGRCIGTQRISTGEKTGRKDGKET